MSYLSLEEGRALEEAIITLSRGGIVAFPTDTVYGIGASLEHPAALQRIYDLKGRLPDKPLPILIARAEVIDDLSPDVDERLIDLAQRFWPGALTVVLPAADHLPAEVKAPDNTIGVRLPNHSIPLTIAECLGGAVATTSANLSGQAAALSAAEIKESFGSKLDLVLDGGFSPQENPSTVIRVVDGEIVVLREGAISADELRAAWGTASR
ncbi:MAG: L-threonylcarbamoyladenylate synthase [Thermomicrobiales bacterium]|nr:L-threonylcarbamoyladenylate synthase [Thermomicrobiales bacterium]MCO5227822.1 L-threonylcarbamoyladenylate synthase [Thermomicrobiales bacterium]